MLLIFRSFLLICFLLITNLVLSAEKLVNSNLPIVYIETNGEQIVDEPKIDATMTIFWEPGEINNRSTTKAHYEGAIGIEHRGNSSQNWPKKPYKFETRDKDGLNLNVSLLGLPKENDWVLHAPYVDKTLLRNALIYRLLNEMGWYAPKYHYCELVINDDYKGVYLLVESLKVDENRINITTTAQNDITGGYLLELTTSNRLSDEEPYIRSSIAEQVMGVKYPKSEEFTAEHKSYISGYINDFEKALYNKDFEGDKDYKNYIDIESFVDHMLVSEVFRQLDAFCASHHFYKDAQGKLVMGPGWDYNRSIGNYKGYDTWKTQGLWLISSRGGCKPFWPKHIYEDEAFMDVYKARYSQLRNSILSTGHIYAIIDEYSHYLDKAKDRNFEVWDLETNKSHKYVQGSYEGEIDYVKEWLKDRMNWLDQQWKVESHPVINEFYPDGEGKGSQWVELYNPSGSDINISGWKLKLGAETFTFPSGSIIRANKFLIVASDKQKFESTYSITSPVYDGLVGSLLKDDITLQLIQGNTVKNEVVTNISKGWPVVSKSGNYAIGMRPVSYDSGKGFYWNWSANTGGSPGGINEIYDYKGLIITELMSNNKQTITDEFNEYDDWVEITNTSNYTINVNGLCLSDNLGNFGKWQLLDEHNLNNLVVEPGKRLLLWLDSDATEQGNIHANFSLQSSGERLLFSYFDGYNYKLIDQVLPPVLSQDQSYQLAEIDANVWVVSDNPTPNRDYNDNTYLANVSNTNFHLKTYPNPVNQNFNVDFHLPSAQVVELKLIDISGRTVLPLLNTSNLSAGHYNYQYAVTNNLPDGIYILSMQAGSHIEKSKLLIIRH